MTYRPLGPEGDPRVIETVGIDPGASWRKQWVLRGLQGARGFWGAEFKPGWEGTAEALYPPWGPLGPAGIRGFSGVGRIGGGEGGTGVGG